MDPMDAIMAFCSATGNKVAVDDFLPVAVARVFELLLSVGLQRKGFVFSGAVFCSIWCRGATSSSRVSGFS